MLDSYNCDLEKLITLLQSSNDLLLLRNQNIKENIGNGGDVDLLVRDEATATEELYKMLGKPWRVIRRSYVTTLYYEWTHVDITETISWRGAEYLDPQAIFDSAKNSANKILRPRLAHEAIICWFSSLIWGGFYKERYADVIHDAITNDEDEFKSILIIAVGHKWGTHLYKLAASGQAHKSVNYLKQLRWSLFYHALFRNPIKTIFSSLSFWFHELRLRVSPPNIDIAVTADKPAEQIILIEKIDAILTAKGCKIVKFSHMDDNHRKNPISLLRRIKTRIRLIHMRAKGCIILHELPYTDIPQASNQHISILNIWDYLTEGICASRLATFTADSSVNKRRLCMAIVNMKPIPVENTTALEEILIQSLHE